MELCDKGELKSLISDEGLPESDCAEIILKLASAIAYLHDNGKDEDLYMLNYTYRADKLTLIAKSQFWLRS